MDFLLTKCNPETCVIYSLENGHHCVQCNIDISRALVVIDAAIEHYCLNCVLGKINQQIQRTNELEVSLNREKVKALTILSSLAKTVKETHNLLDIVKKISNLSIDIKVWDNLQNALKEADKLIEDDVGF